MSKRYRLAAAMSLFAGFALTNAPAPVLHADDAHAECSSELIVLPSSIGAAVPTIRREACADGRIAGAASPLANADFAEGLVGWTVSKSGGASNPGTVSIVAGGAQLAEGDSFLVTLSQTFLLPRDAAELSVRIAVDPGFDRAAIAIPDAFEVSLLDAESAPLLSSWDPLATSSFNLQEDGTSHRAPGVAWDGETLRIDLRAIGPETEATLYFDLIGADLDTASGLRVDDVALELGTADGPFLRGNSNRDLRVDISDGIFTLNYLFLGGLVPGCLDAADANNDSRVDLSDAVYTFNFLFLDGEVLPPPYPICGDDVGPADSLGCEEDACP